MVALGIIGLPLLNACTDDPRGIPTCLHDMADRKFDLSGNGRGRTAEASPQPPATVAERAAGPMAEPVEEPQQAPMPAEPPPAAREPAAPPMPVAPATGQQAQPPKPAPERADDVPLAASVEPVPAVTPRPPPPRPPRPAPPELYSPVPVANWKAPLDPWFAAPPPPPPPPRIAVARASPPADEERGTAPAAVAPPSPPVAKWTAPVDPSVAALGDGAREAVVANIEALPPPPQPVVAAPVVAPPTIDAIELEGDESFISGSGPAGALMRLYTDGKLLGESTVEEGRWLVEAGDILASPMQELRVEAVDPGTGRLLGETTITVEIQLPDPPEAVDAPEPQGTTKPTAPAIPPPAPAPAPPAVAAAPPPAATQTQQQETVSRTVPAVPGPAVRTTISEPRPTAPDAGRPVEVPEPTPPAPSVWPESATVPAVPSPPTAAPAAMAAEVEQARPVPAAPGQPPVAATPAVPQVSPRPVPSPSVTPAPPPASASETTLPDYRPGGTDEPLLELPRPAAPALTAEFRMPARAKPSGRSVTVLKLIPFGDPVDGRFTGGKAIIRRGDTLWSIAHRYYGSGIHYRTIFKANRDLISRPSRIYPGQIFDLPLVTEE